MTLQPYSYSSPGTDASEQFSSSLEIHLALHHTSLVQHIWIKQWNALFEHIHPDCHDYQTNMEKSFNVSLFFKTISWKVDASTGYIDCTQLENYATLFRPKFIVTNTSAYAHCYDYACLRKVRSKQEVFLLANMAQISALVASWVVCSPFEYAIDVICAIQIKGAKAYTIVVFGKCLFALEHFGNEHSIFIVVSGVVVVARIIQDHILFFANIAHKASGIQLKSETSTMDKTSLNKGWHMDKSRQPEHVRQTKWMEVSRYHSHPHLLERDVVTTPLLPLAWPQNSLPLPAGQSHNRTLENGVYGCDTMTHNRDTSREGRLVEPHDSYRRAKLLNPDIYRGEALAEHYDYPRQDGLVEHREYQLVNVEAGLQDVVNHHPYALYSENFSSQDPVYSPHPTYNPPPSLRPEYPLGSLLTEYSSTRGMPPEYHSSPNSLPAFHYHQPVYRY
ncbi:hypothetical protein H5410_034372 [Solanum commersonii]|uniref:Serine hydroxymethyltransferase-like domain-containing protein n=1 Tax=Solanum commersonii TaxID=4109 RepID=A0A9J5YRG3_SOLCO|nr:hypothetical protein H5410_034372 [Solanum commersonii]